MKLRTDRCVNNTVSKGLLKACSREPKKNATTMMK